jgi:hypothetical protein
VEEARQYSAVSDWVWPLLFGAGAVFIAQNLVAGLTRGVIELRSLEVSRNEQPRLYWFAFVTEVFFLGGFLYMLLSWFTGDLVISYAQ